MRIDLSFDRSARVRFVADVRRILVQLEVLFADGEGRVLVLEILEKMGSIGGAGENEATYSDQLLFGFSQTSNLIERGLDLLMELSFDAVDDVDLLKEWTRVAVVHDVLRTLFSSRSGSSSTLSIAFRPLRVT